MSAPVVAATALLRSRDTSTSILTILSFALPHAMLLSVVGGVLAFRTRAAGGVSGIDLDYAQIYVFLAGFAAVLLIVPILTMGAAAARLGMTRRAHNLAILRLIGLGPSSARLACVIDTLVHAFIGTLIGTLLYFVALPGWSFIHFQDQPMRISQMLVPPYILAAGCVLMAVLASLSSWIAVHKASISPLGVVRRQQANRASRLAVIGFAVLLFAWLIPGSMLMQGFPQAVATAILLGFLALIFAGVNAFGAWSLGFLGHLMARWAKSPKTLIAGRRLVEDPKSVWRSFAPVALVGFIVGCIYPVVTLVTNTEGDDGASLFMDDIRTGILLTLAMSVALAAVSTAVNQASRLLDTMDELRFLTKAGAPTSLLDGARRREILVPAFLVIGGAMASGFAFIAPVGFVGAATDLEPPLVMVSKLVAFLIISVLAILLASESTRPLRARLLREQTVERS